MMNADHRSICKFTGHEDQNLKLVKGSIKQLIAESIYSSTGKYCALKNKVWFIFFLDFSAFWYSL